MDRVETASVGTCCVAIGLVGPLHFDILVHFGTLVRLMALIHGGLGTLARGDEARTHKQHSRHKQHHWHFSKCRFHTNCLLSTTYSASTYLPSFTKLQTFILSNKFFMVLIFFCTFVGL